MSITKVGSTRNAGALLRYVLEDKAHDGSEERYISATAHNCTLNNARSDFKKIRDRFNKNDNIQAYSYIISWGKDELDPDNLDDIEKAQEVGHRLGLKIFGDNRQFITALQRDGRGGNLHIHLVGNSIDMYNGSSLSGLVRKHSHIKELSDEIQQEMGIVNKNLEEKPFIDKQSIKEIKARNKGAYVWKDDLKTRIYDCMNNPNILSYDDFKQSLLNDYGVEVVERKSKKKDAYKGVLLTYKFKDKNNVERKARETKLGNTFGLKGVENARKLHIQQERRRQVDNTNRSNIQHNERIRRNYSDVDEYDTEREKRAREREEDKRRKQREHLQALEEVREQLQYELKQRQYDRQR